MKRSAIDLWSWAFAAAVLALGVAALLRRSGANSLDDRGGGHSRLAHPVDADPPK